MIETILYYDGDKIQVDKEKCIVYAWYDNKDSYEEWFKIELKKELFNEYLDSKKSLYDILLKGKTYLFYRNNKTLIDSDFKEITDFSSFSMPDKDSYLTACRD